MKAPVVALFNNKGGVGKTSTLYNLSSMFAELGKRVLAVDLDPQANLTSLALDDETLEVLWDPTNSKPIKETIFHAVQPVIEGTGGIRKIEPQRIPNSPNYALIPGDLRLSEFEDQLAIQWNSALAGKAIGLNTTSSFARIIESAVESTAAEIVFVDVGPNLGAINRAALIATDYVVIPLVPDLFSLQGLTNVGKYLVDWRIGWTHGLGIRTNKNEEYPSGNMQPIGYIILQHRERQSRLVASHQRWANRIPETYSSSVLAEEYVAKELDPNLIGQVRNYQSLMAMSHEARKPIFNLKSADGAIGSHYRVVQETYDTYYSLAEEISKRIGIPLTS